MPFTRRGLDLENCMCSILRKELSQVNLYLKVALKYRFLKQSELWIMLYTRRWVSICISTYKLLMQPHNRKEKKILASRGLFMSWKFVIGIGFLMVDGWLEFYFSENFIYMCIMNLRHWHYTVLKFT